ncbi:protein SPMIP7-like isoform X2 [Macrotis lagotis]
MPVKKMDYPHYCRLLRRMNMPFMRGNENRHLPACFEEKDCPTFLEFHPYASPVQPDYHLHYPYPPPPGKDYALFPHRDDVQLGDPCSGFMSTGGEADLLPGISKTTPNLVSYFDVKPQQRIPFSYYGLQTEIKRRTALLEEINEDPRWNSRKVSDEAIRARLGGWTSPVKVIPDRSEIEGSLSSLKFSFDDIKCQGSPAMKSDKQKAKESFYKSSTQKAYEAVPLDEIYPPKLDPPITTFEKNADQVSQNFTMRRNEWEPSMCQFVGGLWDRFQTRSFTSPKRPINFVSPSSRTKYIPLYTGCVESLEPDDIDNPDGDLSSLGKPRTSKTYPNISRSTNIPGYTGKVHFTATHPANSDIPPTTPSTSSSFRRILWESNATPNYRHLAPLSKMITLVDPNNAFNRVVKQSVKLNKKPSHIIC